ncbi:MAG: class I SAM-dependent methyltransferase [Natronosporangium sp.]
MTTIDEPTSQYAFRDQPDGTGLGRHRQLLAHLTTMLDPFTRRRLDQAGARTASRCLEIGAGSGTIARWLAGQIEPDGQVIATDLDPSQIPPHPRITALTHDITRDPLPDGRFDLIHARLVLAHLPTRHQVLDRLVDALTPGGALVVEEFDASWDRCVLDSPDPDADRLFTSYHHALLAVLVAAGADPSWGRRAHRALRRAGLVQVEAEFWSRTWHGGQAGCQLPHTASAQLADQLTAAGMLPEDLLRFRDLLLDPRLVIHGNTAVSTIGHRPRSTGVVAPAVAAAG